jgi:hypothetical protein
MRLSSLARRVRSRVPRRTASLQRCRSVHPGGQRTPRPVASPLSRRVLLGPVHPRGSSCRPPVALRLAGRGSSGRAQGVGITVRPEGPWTGVAGRLTRVLPPRGDEASARFLISPAGTCGSPAARSGSASWELHAPRERSVIGTSSHEGSLYVRRHEVGSDRRRRPSPAGLLPQAVWGERGRYALRPPFTPMSEQLVPSIIVVASTEPEGQIASQHDPRGFQLKERVTASDVANAHLSSQLIEGIGLGARRRRAGRARGPWSAGGVR